MIRRQLAIATAATILLAGGAHSIAAEAPTSAQAINQSQTQSTNGVIPIPALPETIQEDLGDIRAASNAPFWSYFSGQATVNTEYTSNAQLYHSHNEGDLLIAPSMEGSFGVPLNKYFRATATVRVEDFTYADHSDLGFWGFSGDGEIEYRYRPAWPRIYAGVVPYYYFAYSNGNKLTSAIAPVIGVDQSISINRGKTLLYMGYEFGEYFSSPDIDTRGSHTFTTSLTQQIQHDLYGQIYWQLQYSQYNVFGRDELRNVVGGNLIHQFNPQTYVALFVNYVDNASNNSTAKYESTNVGVSFVWQY
jgi:hypothetical protein